MRGWRMAIRHTTTTRYAGEVFASYNEVRLTPPDTASQTAIDQRIEIEPLSRLYTYVDYWGTIVHTFDVHDPHTELVVTGHSVTDTSASPHSGDAPWEVVHDPLRHEDLCEFLAPSQFVGTDPTLTSAATELRDRASSPATAVQAAIDLVQDRLEYAPGHTTVTTSAVEAWQRRRGVCQDFAHVTLALLRGAGIPARYVSGYAHPARGAPIGEASAGESHAWIDAWIGGWIGFDPTHDEPVAERHVVIGRGRDYGDVAPLRGIYTGAGVRDQAVQVETTRLA
jgi:transglutaminase-like putative cysteine protease